MGVSLQQYRISIGIHNILETSTSKLGISESSSKCLKKAVTFLLLSQVTCTTYQLNKRHSNVHCLNYE